MDVPPILPAYYRLRLRRALGARAGQTGSPRPADSVIISQPRGWQVNPATILPAPQGVGEQKHAPTDMPRSPDVVDNNINVPQGAAPDPGAPADYAHRYRVYSTLDMSESRRRMEDRVRRAKRRRLPCPFRSESGQCTKRFIRCGERSQFSMRETGRQQRLPHRCNYYPQIRGDHVLLVDDDPRMRQFCAQSLALFLDYDDEKILTAGAAFEAIDIIKKSKLSGRYCGLVISDIVMPRSSGYDLVNELYYRNFDTEVLLMKARDERADPPEGYMGNVEILPHRPFVGGTLSKPFHSNELISAISKLRFSRLLE